uniref:Ferritin n=1 Tax=Colobus angolensis palliatus TaxID=336983 RepID=A0A2K5JUV7_COLAP
MTTSSTWQVRHNYHQDSEATINRQISLELYASYIYLSMSYYFDRHNVALKNFAKYFLHQSHEEREYAEKLMKLQNQQGEQAECDGVCITFGKKNVNQSLLELHKLATDKNDPHLCDFIETHYLNEQVKAIKESGSACMLGFPLPFLYVVPKHPLKFFDFYHSFKKEIWYPPQKMGDNGHLLSLALDFS